MAGTRKLGRPSDHRNAMLRGMVTYLLEKGSIETTVSDAIYKGGSIASTVEKKMSALEKAMTKTVDAINALDH